MDELHNNDGSQISAESETHNVQGEIKRGSPSDGNQKGRGTKNDRMTVSTAEKGKPASNIDFLLDIPLEITIELDRTTMLINEMLKLGQGSIIELSKFAGETLDVLANQRLIAKGEVVVINDKYGIRLTEIISPMERLVRLK